MPLSFQKINSNECVCGFIPLNQNSPLSPSHHVAELVHLPPSANFFSLLVILEMLFADTYRSLFQPRGCGRSLLSIALSSHELGFLRQK